MKQDRVVIISGAAGGIGALLVDRFLNNSDAVVATDVNADALQQLQQRLGTDHRLSVVAADIASDDGCHQIATHAAGVHGHVDILINCAGYFPFQPFENMTALQWRQVIDINLTGPFLLTREVLPLMKDRGWGRIINFGSGSVFAGARDQAHYVAAKAGMVGFSRSLARAVGSYGITVNVVTPGLTVTDAVRDQVPAELLQAQRESRALPRDEEPEDLIGAVFFLASADADFITGQTINVDGGKYMP